MHNLLLQCSLWRPSFLLKSFLFNNDSVQIGGLLKINSEQPDQLNSKVNNRKTSNHVANALWRACRLLVLLIGCSGAASSFAATAASEQQQNTASTTPRLVVLAPNLVELLFSLNAGALIVGTSEHADYPAAARSIPIVGNYAGLQLEKIVALQPDFVLYWQSGTAAADVQRLQQLGIKVIGFEPVKLEDIASQLIQLGEISGQQQQAKVLANSFLQQLAKLRQQYQQRTPIKVFYELWDRPLSTIATAAWPQQHLTLCGALNPFANAQAAYPQLSVEQVLVADPQLIIQPVSVLEPRTLLNWQQYPQLTAVKQHQIIQPDSDLLHRATLRTLDGVAALCEQIAQSRKHYQQLAQ